MLVYSSSQLASGSFSYSLVLQETMCFGLMAIDSPGVLIVWRDFGLDVTFTESCLVLKDIFSIRFYGVRQ